MWELVTGKEAFSGLNKVQVLFGVVTEHLRPAIEAETIPAWYTALMSTCWHQDPLQRWDALQL